jgi:hypothetical protein
MGVCNVIPGFGNDGVGVRDIVANGGNGWARKFLLEVEG